MEYDISSPNGILDDEGAALDDFWTKTAKRQALRSNDHVSSHTLSRDNILGDDNAVRNADAGTTVRYSSGEDSAADDQGFHGIVSDVTANDLEHDDLTHEDLKHDDHVLFDRNVELPSDDECSSATVRWTKEEIEDQAMHEYLSNEDDHENGYGQDAYGHDGDAYGHDGDAYEHDGGAHEEHTSLNSAAGAFFHSDGDKQLDELLEPSSRSGSQPRSSHQAGSQASREDAASNSDEYARPLVASVRVNHNPTTTAFAPPHVFRSQTSTSHKPSSAASCSDSLHSISHPISHNTRSGQSQPSSGNSPIDIDSLGTPHSAQGDFRSRLNGSHDLSSPMDSNEMHSNSMNSQGINSREIDSLGNKYGTMASLDGTSHQEHFSELTPQTSSVSRYSAENPSSLASSPLAAFSGREAGQTSFPSLQPPVLGLPTRTQTNQPLSSASHSPGVSKSASHSPSASKSGSHSNKSDSIPEPTSMDSVDNGSANAEFCPAQSAHRQILSSDHQQIPSSRSDGHRPSFDMPSKRLSKSESSETDSLGGSIRESAAWKTSATAQSPNVFEYSSPQTFAIGGNDEESESEDDEYAEMQGDNDRRNEWTEKSYRGEDTARSSVLSRDRTSGLAHERGSILSRDKASLLARDEPPKFHDVRFDDDQMSRDRSRHSRDKSADTGRRASGHSYLPEDETWIASSSSPRHAYINGSPRRNCSEHTASDWQPSMHDDDHQSRHESRRSSRRLSSRPDSSRRASAKADSSRASSPRDESMGEASSRRAASGRTSSVSERAVSARGHSARTAPEQTPSHSISSRHDSETASQHSHRRQHNHLPESSFGRHEAHRSNAPLVRLGAAQEVRHRAMGLHMKSSHRKQSTSHRLQPIQETEETGSMEKETEKKEPRFLTSTENETHGHWEVYDVQSDVRVQLSMGRTVKHSEDLLFLLRVSSDGKAFKQRTSEKRTDWAHQPIDEYKNERHWPSYVAHKSATYMNPHDKSPRAKREIFFYKCKARGEWNEQGRLQLLLLCILRVFDQTPPNHLDLHPTVYQTFEEDSESTSLADVFDQDSIFDDHDIDRHYPTAIFDAHAATPVRRVHLFGLQGGFTLPSFLCLSCLLPGYPFMDVCPDARLYPNCLADSYKQTLPGVSVQADDRSKPSSLYFFYNKGFCVANLQTGRSLCVPVESHHCLRSVCESFGEMVRVLRSFSDSPGDVLAEPAAQYEEFRRTRFEDAGKVAGTKSYNTDGEMAEELGVLIDESRAGATNTQIKLKDLSKSSLYVDVAKVSAESVNETFMHLRILSTYSGHEQSFASASRTIATPRSRAASIASNSPQSLFSKSPKRKQNSPNTVICSLPLCRVATRPTSSQLLDGVRTAVWLAQSLALTSLLGGSDAQELIPTHSLTKLREKIMRPRERQRAVVTPAAPMATLKTNVASRIFVSSPLSATYIPVQSAEIQQERSVRMVAGEQYVEERLMENVRTTPPDNDVEYFPTGLMLSDRKQQERLFPPLRGEVGRLAVMKAERDSAAFVSPMNASVMASHSGVGSWATSLREAGLHKGQFLVAGSGVIEANVSGAHGMYSSGNSCFVQPCAYPSIENPILLPVQHHVVGQRCNVSAEQMSTTQLSASRMSGPFASWGPVQQSRFPYANAEVHMSVRTCVPSNN